MGTLMFVHKSALAHDTGPGHPERPQRLQAVLGAIKQKRPNGLVVREAPEATLDQIRAVHPGTYADDILKRAPASGIAFVDGDTVMCAATPEAAVRSAGGAIAAVDAVLSGEAKNAFSAMRPPGHHAEKNKSMGFCFFDNVAVAAEHARRAHGLKRVAIVDFDVHHGNGTQDIFADEPDVMYCSIHEWPLFPGTGRRDETGIANNLVNVPVPYGTTGPQWRHAIETDIVTALDRFEPELVMISAGFDAHSNDPLAGLEVDETDFAWVTRQLMAAADRHAKGRVVSVLEGGYDLHALANSCLTHLEVLCER